ncbi:MAG: cation-transporting P-type ATPase [Candidatus Thorarchaeota archaeon]|nr:cation-transporting P-type ATPase [Candidatus Thorarchaeota archaeon]
MQKQEAITTSLVDELEFHAMPPDEVLRVLAVDSSQGLSESQVAERLAEFGPNMIPKAKGSFWKVYLAPILNWLITIYLVSSVSLLVIAWLFPGPENEISQATLWLAVVAVNCIVAIFQQYRAQKKLEALERLSAGDARVIRSGMEMEVDPSEIVPGDIIKLEQGDRIPSDARIVACNNLSTNEASLTGESVPVAKDAEYVGVRDSPLTDRINMVFLGTYVATGTARVVVTKTGAKTEIGKIQGELESLNTGDIPLRKKVNLLAKYLGIAAVLLMLFSVAWTVFIFPLLTGTPFNFDVQAIASQLSNGITRAMTIMPINIPLLTTIVLLTGVLAMAKKGVIIRDLSAVESLGRVSVICSDKTGTLTRNQMTVKYVWDTTSLYRVSGDGYEPSGSFFRLPVSKVPAHVNSPDETELKEIPPGTGLYHLLVCGLIDNDSEITRVDIPGQGVVWNPIGDPTDASLLALFRKSRIDEKAVRAANSVVMEFTFESELKRMTKVVHDGTKHRAYVKGATEVVLQRCSAVIKDGRTAALSKEVAAQIQDLVSGFAEKGYRVISLAHRDIAGVASTLNRDQVERDLVYLGFVCIVDPPRDGVREAVQACHSAGINVVMITGDAAATARTIAMDLRIANESSLVAEGPEIATLSDEDFARVNVFARVNPEHKQIIVERYQEQNKVVAMTGDGVNDSLALAMSDAGIAMGITGTDVAKEAADLVITDDSFASIVAGVHQGRGLFNKIRMMIYFYIAINLSESIVFFGGLLFLGTTDMFFGGWQNLYLVVTTHSFPGLALVFDKVSPRAMEEKPRDSEAIITRPLSKVLALNVVLMALGAGLAYWLTLTGAYGLVQMYPENLSWPINGVVSVAHKATIMMFTVLLIVESTLVLIIRRINLPLSQGIREPGKILFAVLLGLIYLAHLLLMYVPVVQELLGQYGLLFYFVPLTWYDWVICVVLSLPAIVGMEAYKRHLRRRGVTL